jgi:hypothetical protein
MGMGIYNVTETAEDSTKLWRASRKQKQRSVVLICKKTSEGSIASTIILPNYQVDPSSALPKRTENGLHHIRTVSYFVKSVPIGIL